MSPTPGSDADAIRALLSRWARAIEAKDLDGIVAHYTPETLLFDAIPPYRTVGRDAIRKAWADCLPFFPERFTVDLADLDVSTSGDGGWAHFLLHFTPVTPPDDPCGQTWMRVTACYRRRAGRWESVHEHVSTPFNPMTNQAWFIKDPAVVDIPDYSAAAGGGAAACGGAGPEKPA